MKADINGKIVEVEDEPINPISRIELLKMRLHDTDYQAIKYAEREMTEEEFAPIKAQRKAWRAEINNIEYMLTLSNTKY